MSKSIIPQPELRQCYVCGARKRLEVHHVMYGHGPRHLSEKYGLKVTLCDMHHRHAPAGIHAGNRELDLRLKAVAQTEFEKIYGHSKWMRTFGRNYLEEPVEVAPVQRAEDPGMLKQGFTFLEEDNESGLYGECGEEAPGCDPAG